MSMRFWPGDTVSTNTVGRESSEIARLILYLAPFVLFPPPYVYVNKSVRFTTRFHLKCSARRHIVLDFVTGDEFSSSVLIAFSASFLGGGFAISPDANPDVRSQSGTWGGLRSAWINSRQ